MGWLGVGSLFLVVVTHLTVELVTMRACSRLVLRLLRVLQRLPLLQPLVVLVHLLLPVLMVAVAVRHVPARVMTVV